jgi:hypothetical protein
VEWDKVVTEGITTAAIDTDFDNEVVGWFLASVPVAGATAKEDGASGDGFRIEIGECKGVGVIADPPTTTPITLLVKGGTLVGSIVLVPTSTAVSLPAS